MPPGLGRAFLRRIAADFLGSPPAAPPAAVPAVTIGDCRFTAIDFESAGAARGRTDVPVQVGLASWSPAAGHVGCFVSYLAADAPITWSARKVHGIRDEDLHGAPTLLSLWPELKARLAGAVVVAHGKGTEKRFLRAFPGHGFGPWVDTLLLARAVWPELPDHSLSALCRHAGLAPALAAHLPQGRWHDALYDALASLLLLEHLIAAHDLAARPLDLLLRPDTSPWHRNRREA
jgi:DNA polymerase-3 subunit epsilon